jgi:hypothetical protein
MERSKAVLAEQTVNVARTTAGKKTATQVWLWGQGKAPSLRPFAELYGKHGAIISAVDLVRGVGILLGWDAFKNTEEYKKNEKIAGFSPSERYFLGYALSWQFHIREESLRNRLLTDVHSPAKYRVNGPFVDVDDFYTAFNIKPDDKMYRADSLRAKIW